MKLKHKKGMIFMLIKMLTFLPKKFLVGAIYWINRRLLEWPLSWIDDLSCIFLLDLDAVGFMNVFFFSILRK